MVVERKGEVGRALCELLGLRCSLKEGELPSLSIFWS